MSEQKKCAVVQHVSTRVWLPAVDFLALSLTSCGQKPSFLVPRFVYLKIGLQALPAFKDVIRVICDDMDKAPPKQCLVNRKHSKHLTHLQQRYNSGQSRGREHRETWMNSGDFL